MLLPSSSALIPVCLLLIAVSHKVLAAVDENKAGNKDGSNWFKNWYASDTVYIDGDGNKEKIGPNDEEGSGKSPMRPQGVASQNDMEFGSGFGPDDEDASHFHGSGDLGREVGTVIEGSGDTDIYVDRTTSYPYPRPRPTAIPTTTTRWVDPWTEPPYEPRVVEPVVEATPPPTVLETPESIPTTVRTSAVPEEEGTDATATSPSSIYDEPKRNALDPFFRPGILAAVIGGAVVGLLMAIFLVMFIVYRMRKKDEGSYALDEPKAPPTYPYAYQKAPTKEFYA